MDNILANIPEPDFPGRLFTGEVSVMDQPRNTTSGDDLSSPPTDESALIRQKIDSLEHEIVGMEHRLVQVVRNAYWALTKREGWPTARRLEAGAALIRYFLVGRATVVIGVGLGGILALHASFMLADQNRKLDLQNHLSVVSGEIAEAQRNSQFAQMIPPLIEEVRQTVNQVNEKSGAPAVRERFPVNTGLRIAVLTQTFQPYRWVENSADGNRLSEPVGSGQLFSLVQGVRRVFDRAFGTSAFDNQGANPQPLQLPILTAQRYSPERGLILLNLHALRYDLRTLTQYNATFAQAYAPRARMNDINLGGMVGPDLSKPFDLHGAQLSDGTFNRAHLEMVDLSGAQLLRSEFQEVQARGIRLVEANLSGADLQWSDFAGAELDRANLKSASLNGLNLSNASLRHAIGLEAKQVSEACINSQTKLDPGLLKPDYKIPTHCCELYPRDFEKDAAGICAAKNIR